MRPTCSRPVHTRSSAAVHLLTYSLTHSLTYLRTLLTYLLTLLNDPTCLAYLLTLLSYLYLPRLPTYLTYVPLLTSLTYLPSLVTQLPQCNALEPSTMLYVFMFDYICDQVWHVLARDLRRETVPDLPRIPLLPDNR